jgi:hypothetical protein
MIVVGQGDLKFEVVEGWGQLPAGWEYGDVSGVACDSADRVYVFSRSEHPVIVFDRDGRFLGSWGEGEFSRPHGITILRDAAGTGGEVAWCTDDKDHTVRKYTLDGRLLQTLGTKDTPSDTGYVEASGANALLTIRRGAGPFNRPTKVAQAPGGDLYVTDGYGNARVHRFTASGELIASWGEPGDLPGQFNLPHSLTVHGDGRVFVCDRENDRVQIFSPTGEYLTSWAHLTRPAELWIDEKVGVVYVAEAFWAQGGVNMAGRTWPETRPNKLSIRDLDGRLLSSWGGPDPFQPGSFAASHSLCLDSHGDLYTGDVARTALGVRYGPRCHPLQKFACIR